MIKLSMKPVLLTAFIVSSFIGSSSFVLAMQEDESRSTGNSATPPARAKDSSNKVSLDLTGEGNFTHISLPFTYYERQSTDRPTLIHQGGYKVYDLANKNDVAVIGPLRPCIGIVVSDGVKLIAFHKHCTNSLESMGKIIQGNLNLLNKDNLHARIYTSKDDIEWKQNNRQLMHGGKSHVDEVKSIKDFLNQTIGIPREKIPAHMKNLRDEKERLFYAFGVLGRYELAEICVAVRLSDVFELSNDKKQIKFSSIDPFTEDVFGYKGTEITELEYLGPNLSLAQQAYPMVDFTQRFLPYDKIPQLYLEQTGKKDGYLMQRGVCERRLDREEGQLYLNYFRKPKDMLFVGEKAYNSLDFYPLL